MTWNSQNVNLIEYYYQKTNKNPLLLFRIKNCIIKDGALSKREQSFSSAILSVSFCFLGNGHRCGWQSNARRIC